MSGVFDDVDASSKDDVEEAGGEARRVKMMANPMLPTRDEIVGLQPIFCTLVCNYLKFI